MWETIKKEPLIKTIFVIFIGILAFGFAFNIMFGTGGSTMDDGAMISSGYSLSSTLENIIGILTKVVIIGLLLGVIVWIFRSITKQTGTGQVDPLSKLKEDPIIKNALIIIGAVVVLILSFSFFRGITNAGSGAEMMNGGYAYSTTYLSLNFTSLFALIIKVLIFTLFISFGYGVVMYFKKNDINAIIAKDTDNLDTVTKDCPDCNSKVKENWKCCPYCGSDKAFNTTTS